ncbi:MAG: polyhydroxyalkanoate synthesis regulator DNA-binding domain-containing protein [Roseiarcus sp.]
MKPASKPHSILVKRHARSRLYDATNRRYVSLGQVRAWAAEGVPFHVVDAEDGADITRVLLA